MSFFNPFTPKSAKAQNWKKISNFILNVSNVSKLTLSLPEANIKSIIVFLTFAYQWMKPLRVTIQMKANE